MDVLHIKGNDLWKYFGSDFVASRGITGIYGKERLFSKKNDVYKIEVESVTGIGWYVLKKYRGKDRYSRMKNELYFYSLLQENGLQVPPIFYEGEEVLVTRFTGDRTLLDYIIHEENQAPGRARPDSTGLAKWLPLLAGSLRYIYDFNRTLREASGKSYILNDMNFRNFLLAGGDIFRVDLEECRAGLLEEDMGKFMAFFLTYDPPFTTWKRSVSESMKSLCRDIMDMDITRIELEIKKELIRMDKRRDQKPDQAFL